MECFQPLYSFCNSSFVNSYGYTEVTLTCVAKPAARCNNYTLFFNHFFTEISAAVPLGNFCPNVECCTGFINLNAYRMNPTDNHPPSLLDRKSTPALPSRP